MNRESILATYRPLHVIAKQIKNDYFNMSCGAKPYVQAMMELTSIDEPYYAEDARGIVQYFLANAVMWRGPVARNVKKELNCMLNYKEIK